MTDRPKRTIDTQAVHAGEPRSYPYDALAAPIAQTATYTFANTQELHDFFQGKTEREEYGRYGNPTVRLVEEKVAALEGAEDAVAFASGMAAVTTTILALVKSGSHVILFSDCYRRTRQFVKVVLGRFGVEHTLVPPADLDALKAAIRPETRLIVSEAPTNPFNTVLDLPKLAAIAKEHRVKTMIDSTFATPVNLRPFEHGIDLVVHSGTKYLGGHNDVLAGVVAGKHGFVSLIRDLRHVLGAVMDPHAAYLVHRGLKTLAVRVARQNQNAQALAEALEGHPKVKQVWYPGLASHPQHDIAKQLMAPGYGGVVTFALDATLEQGSKFVDALEIPRIAPSLGGVESLVEQPALMSYYELSTEQRLEIGIPDELIRYAVGLEDADELIADVLRALEQIA
ncbi:MAG: aminotransferase class I/II-fold pyridoxal phosphate-dependent enzyme [Sandaracinaceae bacterium]